MSSSSSTPAAQPPSPSSSPPPTPLLSPSPKAHQLLVESTTPLSSSSMNPSADAQPTKPLPASTMLPVGHEPNPAAADLQRDPPSHSERRHIFIEPPAKARPSTANAPSSSSSLSSTTTTTLTKATTTAANRIDNSAAADCATTTTPTPTTTTKPKPAASRLLRRAFSMPRNPFRLSSRKQLKVNGDGGTLNERAVAVVATTNGIGDRHSNEAALSVAASSTTGSYTRTGEVHAQMGGLKHLNSGGDERSNGEQAANDGAEPAEQNENDGAPNNNNNAVQSKRRAQSWRKVILRLAHQMTSIGNKQSHGLTNGSGPRVPPLTAGYLDAWPADQIPGVTGLKNHGNTCFMNAVLQCLSHTDILAEYFVLDQYKVDLKRRNKLTSRKFGTKGELTEQLALVLKALWTCKLESDWSATVGFKAVVDRHSTQFRSAQQHDAQEFLNWLLDKVHEDLNTAPKRKYKTIKNTFGRPDAVLAAETLANHVRGNRSFVQAVFQAQFRSSLACPQCHRQSNTFDPFHCISVQLPQQHVQLPVYVTVRYASQHPRQVRLGLSVPSGAPVSALRAQLQTDTGIEAARIVLVELNDDSGFGRVLADSYTMDATTAAVNVYCMEMPTQSAAGQDAAEREARKCDGMLTILVANARRTGATAAVDATVERFGTPFCVEIRRDVTYAELQKRLLKEMQHVLRPDIFAYAVPPAEMFRMRLQDPSADSDAYMEPRCEHPLFMEMIDLALVVLAADAGPPHVKLLLEWQEPERFFADMADEAVEHESVTLVRDQAAAVQQARNGAAAALSLEQCLEHYTRAETLGAEDAWRCPHCQQYLPVVKTLGLWSLPEILVIHFKRFAAPHHPVQAATAARNGSVAAEAHHVQQQHAAGRAAAKLTTTVTFPLTGFDMTPHLAQQQQHQQQQHHQQRSAGADSEDMGGSDTAEHNLYDLYAVCYHQGETLETGHYTAACKNPYDQQWYRFDDQKVTAVPGGEQTAAEIVNNEAYILFYQRRVATGNGCNGAGGGERSGASTTANGSLSAGLSTLGLSEHWVSRIAAVPPVSPLSSSISQGSIGMSFGTSVDGENGTKGDDESDKVAAENTPNGEENSTAVTEPPPSPVAPQLQSIEAETGTTVTQINLEPITVSAATFELPQFAELCHRSPSTSGSESPSETPPTSLRNNKSQTINRGSLSFSEVFRRREPPLLYVAAAASGSSGGVNNICATTTRHSADQRTHSFLSENASAARLRSNGRAKGASRASGGGSGTGSASYLLVDNRSASWVS